MSILPFSQVNRWEMQHGSGKITENSAARAVLMALLKNRQDNMMHEKMTAQLLVNRTRPYRHAANGTPSTARDSLPIRPTNRLQDSSQCRDRANEQQHRQNSHQKESCFHVVHHRDHTASLLLLDSPTPPTEPGTYLGSFLSLLNAYA